MATGNITHDSRTIHTIRVTVPDDVLAPLGSMDEVEVILVGRTGETAPKKLNYRDLAILLDNWDGPARRGVSLKKS